MTGTGAHAFPSSLALTSIGLPMRLAVLGGSGPFTIGLFEAVASASVPAPGAVTLFGRDRDALQVVAGHARRLLGPQGWRVRWTDRLEEALEGATVILHQIRYGGLDGRREDEGLAGELGCPADETLGPGGLSAALRMTAGLRATASAILRLAPDAVVLNLTNPLSCAVAMLVGWGVGEAIGLCELPRVTMEAACRGLEVAPAEVAWSYSGLNHRGFIHVLRQGDRDLLSELPALGERTIGGIHGEELRDLGALPLKYFAQFRTKSRPSGDAGRAAYLREVRARILEEARSDPSRTPPSLRLRPAEWYTRSVVPMLEALCRTSATEQVVNLWCEDGVVREVRALVSSSRIDPIVEPPPPDPVARWIDRFERCERLVLAAAADPGPHTIRTALEADPLMPASKVEQGVRLLWERQGSRS